MFPESNLVDFPKWFRKRSLYHVRIYEGVLMKIRFPVSASARIGMLRSVMLNSCFRETARRLKEYAKCPHKFRNTFLDFPESVRMRSVDGSGTELITEIIVTFWLWIMT